MRFKIRTPLFDQEGAIGASSGAADATPGAAEPPVSPSVAAGEQTPPAEGSAPAAGTGDGGVTQQASFAARLKEERTKIAGEFEPYKARAERLEKLAKDAGFESSEAYLEAWQADLQRASAAAEAQRLGVDQETYDKYFAPVHSELAQTKQQLDQLRQADLVRQIKSDDERLSTQYPEYKEMRDQVWELAEKRAMPLEDAFKLVAFDRIGESAKMAGQAEAIAKLQQNAQTSTGAAGGDAPSQAFDFTKLPREERAKYYEKAKRGELSGGLR